MPYIVATFLLALQVLWGFWPYYSGLFLGGVSTPWFMHIHAVIFTSWLALLFVQTTLVHQGNRALHVRIGKGGVVLGVLIILAGWVVTFLAPAHAVQVGRMTLDEAAGFIILPLGDMIYFMVFFIAAVAYRRQKDLHKRYMMLAALTLSFPGAARATIPYGLPMFLVVWLAPLALLMAHDWYARRRVELVYLIGGGALLLGLLRLPLMESPAWLVIGRQLVLG